MKIEFIPASQDVEICTEYPKPSKLFIPEWYKDSKPFDVKNPEFSPATGRLINTSIKMCMPFLDAFNSGYIQKTWCDIYIKNENNIVSFYYSTGPEIMHVRESKSVTSYEKEFYEIEFIWLMPWAPKTPEGYSVIITHPLNRVDLPFYTLTGIIDSDKYHHGTHGNLPFFIKNGFTGLIPAGTPMYQIIPIKRDSWSNDPIEYNERQAKKRMSEQLSKFWGFYKNNMWQKKEYL